MIEPLRVIDQTKQRTLLGDLGNQVESSQSNEEPVRSWAASQSQGHAERYLLRFG
nr:hypothetical protein [Mycetocola zhujimingii]